MTLFVVYTPKTGNVVGAVNAIGGAPPADDTDVGALVGEELPLRVALDTDIAILKVPAGTLAFHTPDDKPDVLTNPLGFGVEQVPDQKPKPALLPLPVSTTTLTFTGTALVVPVDPAPTHDTAVLAFVSDGLKTIQQEGTITAGKPEVELPMSVQLGQHGVLVLVAGWAGRLERVTK
jgi:hypothetical protein